MRKVPYMSIGKTDNSESLVCYFQSGTVLGDGVLYHFGTQGVVNSDFARSNEQADECITQWSACTMYVLSWIFIHKLCFRASVVGACFVEAKQTRFIHNFLLRWPVVCADLVVALRCHAQMIYNGANFN